MSYGIWKHILRDALLIMAHHSKKAKKKPAGTPQPQRYTQSETVVRYFLAAAGLVVLIVVILGLLGYFKII